MCQNEHRMQVRVNRSRILLNMAVSANAVKLYTSSMCPIKLMLINIIICFHNLNEFPMFLTVMNICNTIFLVHAIIKPDLPSNSSLECPIVVHMI